MQSTLTNIGNILCWTQCEYLSLRKNDTVTGDDEFIPANIKTTVWGDLFSSLKLFQVQYTERELSRQQVCVIYPRLLSHSQSPILKQAFTVYEKRNKNLGIIAGLCMTLLSTRQSISSSISHDHKTDEGSTFLYPF